MKVCGQHNIDGSDEGFFFCELVNKGFVIISLYEGLTCLDFVDDV